MPMLADAVDAVIGVDTHRDVHHAEIAAPSGAAIATFETWWTRAEQTTSRTAWPAATQAHGAIQYSSPLPSREVTLVAMLLLAVLHFLPDTDYPAAIAATLAAGLAPGSYLAISHLTADLAPQQVTAAAGAYNAPAPSR
jgi:S-adenosyl methyltransferase